MTPVRSAQRGRPYSAIGGGPLLSGGGKVLDAIGFGEGAITCVGLTEGAYEEGVGREIVPEIAQILLTPYRQFTYTTPVNRVKVKEGEPFELKITTNDGNLGVFAAFAGASIRTVYTFPSD